MYTAIELPAQENKRVALVINLGPQSPGLSVFAQTTGAVPAGCADWGAHGAVLREGPDGGLAGLWAAPRGHLSPARPLFARRHQPGGRFAQRPSTGVAAVGRGQGGRSFHPNTEEIP